MGDGGLQLHIAYYDESGDDGYPAASSPLFVLTTVYLEHSDWQPVYRQLVDFRRTLKDTFGIPVRMEMHTRHFVMGKKPYTGLGLHAHTRANIIDQYCDHIAGLNVKIINVAIVKPRIKSQSYEVLDTALKYSVQRIETDVGNHSDLAARYLIITDEGRVGKMRNTTRRIQRINYIPSMFGRGFIRREIKCLIEDPLPKASNQSYFVQLADLVAYVVYLFSSLHTDCAALPTRMPSIVNQSKITDWMDRLVPSLNLMASKKDPYGIKFHPN